MKLRELIVEKINKLNDSAIEEVNDFRGDLSITLKKAFLLDICKMLKEDDDLQFVRCEDVTAIDWAKRKNRFTVVYHIYSLKNKFRLRLKVNLGNENSIETVTPVWKSADWYERETYDMYGVEFLNHPDPRRMYMPEQFEYHPLRKDFPVMGIPGSLPLPKKEEDEYNE
jgi:NADH-quinone oxidoreductase subunit C